MKTLALRFAALLCAALPTIAAHADTLNFTISNPTQSTVRGGTLVYQGTVSAPSTNTGVVYLNGDDYNFSAPYTIDDTPFLTNFPLSLSAGQSYTGALFDVLVPLNSPINNFTGSFLILGGATDSASGTLASANFTSNVTPEPSSFVLLGTGLLGAAGALRRKMAFRNA